jgi:hypothetical protein
MFVSFFVIEFFTQHASMYIARSSQEGCKSTASKAAFLGGSKVKSNYKTPNAKQVEFIKRQC